MVKSAIILCKNMLKVLSRYNLEIENSIDFSTKKYIDKSNAKNKKKHYLLLKIVWQLHRRGNTWYKATTETIE